MCSTTIFDRNQKLYYDNDVVVVVTVVREGKTVEKDFSPFHQMTFRKMQAFFFYAEKEKKSAEEEKEGTRICKRDEMA